MKKIDIVKNKDGWLEIGGADISVFRTFDCGQCFRFNSVSDGRFSHRVDGVAFGRSVSFAETDENTLFVRASEDDFCNIWFDYLALGEDYAEYNEKIASALSGDGRAHIERAIEASRGIRILHQDKWEALCSFIVSQNNNIPRIKKIIETMSAVYGEKIEGGYSFPTPEALRDAGEEKIFELKTGFRAKYIIDAASKVASGELDLSSVSKAKTYSEAEQMLLSVKGVGAKVAACALLFGFGRLEAFPVDVWIKRVMEKRFGGMLDPAIFGDVAGIAQQYLFYYERYIGD